MSDEVQEVEPEPPIGRGIRVRRLRLVGVAKNYDVDFTQEGLVRPLSIIAGRINTGKTSILRFVDYALGADGYPEHAEIARQVRSVQLEVETPEGVFTLERGLGARDVFAYPTAFQELEPVEAMRLIVSPPADPRSVSQWLLTTVDLQNIQLKEAPTKSDSNTDRMSFRDLMWTVLFLNERVGSTQLLHAGHWIKELKLQQVVDAIFGVHDNEQADLNRRIREAQSAYDASKHAVALLEDFVAQQENGSLDALEVETERLDKDLRTADAKLRAVTVEERAAAGFLDGLRAAYEEATSASSHARARLRDRTSLIDRFASLRAQYADDVRKMTLVVEADFVFDQLSVTTCPACLRALPPLTAHDGLCDLCQHPVADQHSTSDSGRELAIVELQSAKRRFKDLDDYWKRLLVDLPEFEREVEEATVLESSLSTEIDEATWVAVSPFVAQRDQIQRERQALLVMRNSAQKGIRLLTGLEARRTEVDRAERSLSGLKKQLRELINRPDRDSVLGSVSRRFGDILCEIGYPKIEVDGETPPYINNKLVPFVRGLHFKEASSGGQVLISIAWMLAIFEVAYETRAAHPGVLMIDTFQKNLGGKADQEEFAGIRIVERLYVHISSWLANQGLGAQVIVVDNTPPDSEADAVVVRYTRDPAVPPFGLIDNETGARAGEGAE